MFFGLKPSELITPLINAFIWVGGTGYAFFTWRSTQKVKDVETTRLEAIRLETLALQAAKDKKEAERTADHDEAERAARWKADALILREEAEKWETRCRERQAAQDAHDAAWRAVGLTCHEALAERLKTRSGDTPI